jgi:WD40 repeat protein
MIDKFFLFYLKLFLEAPCDVFSFAFSPTEPHIVAGGCINGQVALWDIKQYEDRIINPRGDHREKDLFIVKSILICI